MVDRSKSEQYKNHPLNGVGLKAMLKLLVDHYGWETLDQQININCFKSKPSIASSYKFLHRTQWAREKVEAFYLYKFMQYPRPTDEQHKFSPREREIDLIRVAETPAIIDANDPEFFDDPISGPVFPTKKAVSETRAQAKKKSPSSKSSVIAEEEVVEALKDGSKELDQKPSRRAKEKENVDVNSDVPASSSSNQDSSSKTTPDPWSKWKK